MTTAFVYKWTHIPTLKWYVGVRTAKGCHPDDGYICSSKRVKPLIKKSPNEWVRTVIEVGEPEAMLALEAEILDCVDALNDSRSWNLHNGDGKFTTRGIPNPLLAERNRNREQRGSANPMYGKDPWNKGKKGSQVAWNKGVTGNASHLTGRKRTPASIYKMLLSNYGQQSADTWAKKTGFNIDNDVI